jgi:conjugal transfer pilus assembly protein TraF
MFILLFMLSLLFQAGPVLAAAGFYERGAEGWFWYQDPVPAVEAEPESEAPASPPPAPAATEPAPAAEPAPLSAAWFRAHLDRYRDAAIDDPTPAKVAAWLYLQRIALDKASRFSEATQRVALKDPWLDETVRRPLASFAAAEMSRRANTAREEVLRNLAGQAGLWFFFRSDCPYCHLQATVIEQLERQYGFTVYPISLDGAPLPDGRYPRVVRDTGQATALGVVTVPALFLARPPGEVLPLGQGVLALDQLLSRMLTVAAEAGWITPDEHTRTRPVRTDWLLQTNGAGLTDDVLHDPARLIETLRAAGHPPPVSGD